MNKKEVAEFLNVSEKTVERYKASGKLSARMKRVKGDDGKTRKILDFNENEVKQFKRKQSDEILYPTITDGHTQTKTQTDTDGQTESDVVNLVNNKSLIVGQTQTVSIINAIFERIESVFERQMKASDRAQKLMLSIEEASEISGLSKAFIRQSIKSTELKAKIIGRGYKIKRSDLNEFINNL